MRKSGALGVARMGHPFWRAALVCMALLLLAPLSVTAQEGEPVSWHEATAQANFPQTLDFALKAGISQGTVVRAEVAYSFTGEPLTHAEVVSLEPAAEIDLSASVDTQVNYIPPGVDVSYYWTVTDDQGRTFSSPTGQLRYEDTRYAWQMLEDGERRLRLHWYEGSAEFGQMMFDTSMRSLGDLSQKYGITLTLPVEIWVYPNSEELALALPAHQPEWLGAQAFVQHGIIMAIVNEQLEGESEAGRLLPHELSHVVVHQASANPYNGPPAWLDEGLAVNNQLVQEPIYDKVLQEAAEAGQLLPLRTLGGSFPADPEVVNLYYAESASAVQFLLERYGPAKVGAVLAAFRAGVTYDEALTAGVGLTTDELDRQWREWLPYKSSVQPQAPTATESAPATSTRAPEVTPTAIAIEAESPDQPEAPATTQQPREGAGAISPVLLLLAGALTLGLLATLGIISFLLTRERTD